jgi:hypothetical protein
MSTIDENQIRERLERLSKIEPAPEATERALARVRETLANERTRPQTVRARIFRAVFGGAAPRLAAAAVVLIGAGYVAGRLSAPRPLDVQGLQAAMESSLRTSLEPAIQREVLDEMTNRLQLARAADRDALKQELRQQVNQDLQVFADQTLTAVGNLTDRRFMEFARMVEAARVKDRQRVAAAFDYMGSRFGNDLVALAAQTNKQQHPEQN